MTEPKHGALIGGAVCLDVETVLGALPLETKKSLVARVFADEEFITRVVDVLTSGITTEDVGSLYSSTLDRLQLRLSEKWPEMARGLLSSLIRKVRFAEESLVLERHNRNQWILYHRDPINNPCPELPPPLPMVVVDAGLAARDAEVDRILAAIVAAEKSAGREADHDHGAERERVTAWLAALNQVAVPDLTDRDLSNLVDHVRATIANAVRVAGGAEK